MANRGDKETCLGCSKKFNKSEYSLQCTVCGLWIHKTCAGISDDGYKFVSEQLKTTGMAYWACRPCTSYAINMNHRLKTMEDKMNKFDKEITANTASVKNVSEKVEKISEDLKKKDENVKKLVKQGEFSIFEEMRERETRRLNVIFFGIGELEERNATGMERLDWDKKSCRNIFTALEIDMGVEDLKFCRRIGEKKDEPRPLVVGFHSEVDRAKLLKRAKNLEKTVFTNVSVGPDMTKKQRDEENEMKREAEKRNSQLTEEDRSKNLQWIVVGARGEKRITKTVPREQSQRGRETVRGGRGGARESRGRNARGGTTRSGTSRGGTTSGANSTPVRTRQKDAEKVVENGDGKETENKDGKETESEEEKETDTESDPETAEEMETETEMETGIETRRKRKKRSGETAMGPPEKR